MPALYRPECQVASWHLIRLHWTVFVVHTADSFETWHPMIAGFESSGFCAFRLLHTLDFCTKLSPSGTCVAPNLTLVTIYTLAVSRVSILQRMRGLVQFQHLFSPSPITLRGQVWSLRVLNIQISYIFVKGNTFKLSIWAILLLLVAGHNNDIDATAWKSWRRAQLLDNINTGESLHKDI